MPNMVILVLDDVARLEEVMDAWRAAGSRGITILESSGMARLKAMMRDDLPLFPSLSNLLQGRTVHHRTLFTVLGDDIDVEAFFDATEAVLGPLDTPHTGIIFALPVSSSRGLNRDAGRTPKPTR
ncbi:MAG: hypothetical protein BWY52_02740 [Chloroflexi bacterium ADurb.Bin325]|nr:MAG: hypothetical protein BWY52_02740 [Chloroflexi bacterium ADurb.Bin325]